MKLTLAFASAALILLSLAACSPPTPANSPPQNSTICIFGDSLVAGVGAEDHESYPAQLAELTGHTVIAVGTSGDTTAQALQRIARVQDQPYGIIIVTLGGNDIIRRVPWDETRENLRQLFQKLQETGAVVAYTGVIGPLNFSRDKKYRKLCEEEGVFYISDILDGILSDPRLKADDVHPNAAGYRLMAERVADALRDAQLLNHDDGSS